MYLRGRVWGREEWDLSSVAFQLVMVPGMTATYLEKGINKFGNSDTDRPQEMSLKHKYTLEV